MTGKEAKKRLKDQYAKQADYVRQNYDRVSVTLPKGTKDRIKQYTDSINGLITDLLLNWLEKQDQQENKTK